MSGVVDPGSPSSSGAVVRKQFVVGCIVLLLNLLTGWAVIALVSPLALLPASLTP